MVDDGLMMADAKMLLVDTLCPPSLAEKIHSAT